MSDDVVIRVEGLGKNYVIGHVEVRERYTALRDVVARTARNVVRRTADMARGRTIVQGDVTEEFWALRDVSLEVKRGEVVGVVGRNGAGKSTLLKILSRITEPTEGRVVIRGQVASLLEVGTGFHPELTGRENIYLNGAILGMRRSEIRRRFDEIVAFADIERFLDTPAKRYSSGMYVRLAFAVAAHVDPEILLVDEVLAVGDLEFQKKCLGKMDETAKSGRTVLFVSHDMARVTSLCSRGLLLNAGRIEVAGKMSAVADAYLMHRLGTSARADLSRRGDRRGTAEGRFQSIEILKAGEPSRLFGFGESLTQRIAVRVDKRIGRALLSSTIRSSTGVPIYEFMNPDEGHQWIADVGDYVFTVTMDRILLYPGTYSIDLWLGDKNSVHVDYLLEAITFTVVQNPASGLARRLDQRGGIVFQNALWEFDKIAS